MKRKLPAEAKKFVSNDMRIEREHKDGTKYVTSDIYSATDPASIKKLKSIYSNQQIANAINELGKSNTSTVQVEATDEDIADTIQPKSVKNSNAQKEEYLTYLQQVKTTKKKAAALEKQIKELQTKLGLNTEENTSK